MRRGAAYFLEESLPLEGARPVPDAAPMFLIGEPGAVESLIFREMAERVGLWPF